MKRKFSVLSLLLLISSHSILYAQPKGKVNDHTTPQTDQSASLQAPTFEEMQVYRLQLKLTTGRTNDAGTDDPVYVQMNTGNEKFYLVKGIDNFVQGKTVIYDILIDKIKKVKDIDFIKFGINGGDGLCLKKIELLLNNYNQPLFVKEYQGQRGICFDNGSGSMPATITIPGEEIRSSTKWNYSGNRRGLWRPPVQITNTWLKSLVEASIGNQVYQEGGSVKWGTVGGTLENKTLFGPAVEMSRKDYKTLHFDLDLEADINGPNPEVDLDFDLELICNDGKIETQVINARITSDNIGTLMNRILPVATKLLGVGIGVVVGGVSGGPVSAMGGAATGFALSGKIAHILFGFKAINVNNPQLSLGCNGITISNTGSIDLR